MNQMFAMMRDANGHIVNYDEKKEIHYGVINQNQLDDYATEDIIQNGTDIYYEDALSDFKESVASWIEETMGDSDEDIAKIFRKQFTDNSDTFIDELIDAVISESDEGDRKNAAEEYIDDMFGQDYQQDTTLYYYEDAGYKIRFNTDDGDLFIIDSPYYTFCNQCSPCCPNAGYLTDRHGSMKTFCLGAEWFEEGKVPYDVYDVAINERVYEYKEEDK